MKMSSGKTTISTIVAQGIKAALIILGTFLWIESRIPPFSKTKKNFVPKRSHKIIKAYSP